MKRFLPKSEFGRNVLTLMSGSGAAQALPIMISPILTRIYEPSDFGLYAIYVLLISILGGIATLKYELAIIQADTDDEANVLLILTVIISLVISLFLLIIFIIYGTEIADFLENPDIKLWLILAPISILITGISQAYTYWHIRNKNYSIISTSTILGAGTTSTLQILGVFFTHSGLILALVLGRLANLINLIKQKEEKTKLNFNKNTKKDIFASSKKYSQLPKYAVFGALVDNASVQLPILFINKFYGLTTTGFFSLTFRVLNLPASLISSALSKALMQKIVEIKKNRSEYLYKFLIKILFILVSMTAPVVIVFYFFSNDIFALIFGENWREAGSFAKILIFAIAIRFIVSPLSGILALKEYVKYGTAWQIIYFSTMITTLYFLSSQDITTFIYGFVAHEIALYTLYLFIILKVSRLQSN